MNEYTRREEVRWTFISSLCLLLFIGPAVWLLMTPKIKTIPDPNARLAAKAAANQSTQMHACASTAEHFSTEVDVFKSSAKAAHVDAPDPAASGSAAAAKTEKKKHGKGAQKEKPPDTTFAWPTAQPSSKLSKALAPCQTPIDAAVGPRADAAPGWAAIAAAAAIEAPPASDTAAQVEAARSLYKLLNDAPIDKVIAEAHDADKDAQTKSEAAKKHADTATVVEPIPEGVVPRRVALGVGIGICVMALLLSYLSVRVASLRRLGALVPLRDAARTSMPGQHASAILRLAAQNNGGEPGLVIGGAAGGLAAAAAFRSDTDMFAAGVMLGLVMGFGVQALYRVLTSAGRWRKRATELADVEKPAIPVVLVLSGVDPGLEGPFISFFSGLSPEDAASTVEKLAAQAEEKILQQADANR